MKTQKIVVKEISKTKTGSGHWKIFVRYEVDGESESDSFTTTDSQAIDDWDEESENYPDTGANFIVRCHFAKSADYGNAEIIYKF